MTRAQRRREAASTRTHVAARWVPLAFACASLAGGCLFAPAVEDSGYTRCASDEECAAGRACFSGLCSPPPWNDEGYARRRLIVVKNTSAEEPLVTGTAVPVRIGAAGLLESADLGVDGRLTFYSFAAGAWSAVPVWRDVYDDHLFLYVPTQGEVPPGEERALFWLENQTGDREPGFVDDGAGVFPLLYDDLEGDALAAERWDTFGTGAPTVANGRVNVADNQKLVAKVPLAPPFSLTWKGRINGVTCDQTYVGLVSDDGAGFEPPSAGFFVKQDLVTDLEVGPTADSVPQQPPDVSGLTLDTALHRYRLDVASQKVRFSIDGEVVGEPATIRFQGEQLYFIVDVDGACSFDLEVVHASPMPFARPELRADAVVQYEILD